MLLCLLGKHECKNIRKDFLEGNSSVMTERDYAKSLKAQFDMEIQSEEYFDSNLIYTQKAVPVSTTIYITIV